MFSFKNNKNYLFCAAAALALTACGTGYPPEGRQSASAPAANVVASGHYVTSSDLAVQSTASGVAERASTAEAVIPRGTEVTVLESKQDANGETFLRLGVDSDDQSLPSDVWVTKAAALEAGFLEADGVSVDPTTADDSLAGLSEEAAAARRMTYCYRFVKQYLLQTGKVHVYLPGGSAWMAAGILPRYGFHNTGAGPGGAQEGDVCVYAGGNGGNGHIEVKRGGGWWYGYGLKPSPITPVNHRLLGCFRK